MYKVHIYKLGQCCYMIVAGIYCAGEGMARRAATTGEPGIARLWPTFTRALSGAMTPPSRSVPSSPPSPMAITVPDDTVRGPTASSGSNLPSSQAESQLEII